MTNEHNESDLAGGGEFMLPAGTKKGRERILSSQSLRRMSNSSIAQMREELLLEGVRRSLARTRDRTADASGDLMPGITWDRNRLADELLEKVRERHDELATLLERYSSDWEYADPIYRMYHISFKVYHLQDATLEIVTALQSLMPRMCLHSILKSIVAYGTGYEFEMHHNRDWLRYTIPITTAFFHAKFFLEMAVRCGAKYDRVGNVLPSDLAALLYLFDLR